MKQICADLTATPATEKQEVEPPAKEIVTSEIAGIEIMELDDAVKALWAANIYAESGMGCTGPIVLVNEKNVQAAQDELKKRIIYKRKPAQSMGWFLLLNARNNGRRTKVKA